MIHLKVPVKALLIYKVNLGTWEWEDALKAELEQDNRDMAIKAAGAMSYNLSFSPYARFVVNY